MRRRWYIGVVSVGIVCAMVIGTLMSVKPALPVEGRPVVLYSNTNRDDLSLVLSQSIAEAERSVEILVFSLTDNMVLHTLRRKAEEGVSVNIVTDIKNVKKVGGILGDIADISVSNCRGLMHRKVLIVDGERVFISSANMTSESLRMHDNLTIGLHSAPLAQAITSLGSDPILSIVGGQSVEYWSIPEHEGALERIIGLIEAAQKTIDVAQFTFTNMRIVDALIGAHERDVRVRVIVDYTSGKGASKRVVNRLKEAGIAIETPHKIGLLHHKYALIDDTTCVTGSANWTKAAFRSNEECFLIMHNITPQQHSSLRKMWRRL